MKCIIPGINLKVFGRAIHSLAKIGDELYFEPLEQGLSLRTVNSSRSAYACFLFFPSYFQHYDDGKKQAECSDSEEEEEELRCKIIMKSVMAVFRSLSTIEKTVEKCKITHNAKEARLVFELHCRHGIVKKHNLAYIECETLQAIFSKDLCPNKLTAPSKLLCEVVVNFQTTQEEVTLTVHPDLLTLKNYVEDEPDPNKVVHTELSLAPEEFDLYQVGVDTDITFCLKELRAILAFGETTGLPLNINFEAAGRPVTFCIDSDQTFEANFVLATLADAEQVSSQMPASQRGQQSASHSRHKQPAPGAGGKQGGGKGMAGKPGPSRNVHHNGDVSGPGKNTEPQHARTGPASSRAAIQEDDDNLGDISTEELAAAMEVERDWEIAERDRHPQTSDKTSPPGDQGTEKPASPHTRGTKNDEPSPKQKAGQSSSHRQGAKDRHAPAGKQERDRACGYQEERRKPHSRERERETSSCGQGREMGDGGAATSSHLKRAEGGGGGRWGEHRLQTSEEDGGEEEGVSASPVFPVQSATADVTREGPFLQPLSGEDNDDDDLDETIPGTPPSTPPAKKFRSLFFGSSQKRSQPTHNTTVLAADTDEED